MPPRALEGIRVCDLTAFWSGTYATYFLGGMGAEVIKVESIQRPDGFRFGAQRYGATPVPRFWETSPMWLNVNLNKYGVTLDLNRPRGKDLFLELVKISDVVIDNFSPRVMENFGLAYPVLREVKPDIIMMSMSTHGTTGPWRDHAGFALAFEHLAGLSYLTGFPDGGPHSPGGAADPIIAVHAAFALLAALEYRRRTGKGQFIEMAQVETLAGFYGAPVVDYSLNKRVWGRLGNRDRVMAPHGVYRCRGEDAWVAIAVSSDDEWQRLCRAMGDPEWTADERFATVLGRWSAQDDLDPQVERWTAGQDCYEVMHLLQQSEVPAGVVVQPEKLDSDPHLAARDFFQALDRDVIGCQLYGRFPALFSATPQVNRPAPTLGQHNDYVLGTLLGLSAGEIAELEKERITGTEPIL